MHNSLRHFYGRGTDVSAILLSIVIFFIVSAITLGATLAVSSSHPKENPPPRHAQAMSAPDNYSSNSQQQDRHTLSTRR